MLTTLLSNLQTYITSRFVVASFFPMLAFWFGHATMLFLFNAPFQAYVVDISTKQTGLATVIIGAALLFVTFLAYALQALMPTIQSWMEGNAWPSRIAPYFVVAQMARYEALNAAIDENRKLRGMFGPRPGGTTQAELWQRYLAEAREIGANQDQNGYTGIEESAQLVGRLADERRRAKPISDSEIQTAVATLSLDLRNNNADIPNPAVDTDPLKTSRLEQTRALLWDLIDYGYRFAFAQHRLFLTRRQFDFGALPLAPTTMGNIAKSVQSYAIRRYDFNFEQLWSRLQLAAQKDPDFGPVLRDAKTQLDFLISCSVLMLLWALVWAVWLASSSGPRWVFLVVALAGPIAAYGLYLSAVEQYRTLANLLRGSVDLFRFDLLRSLGYPEPASVLDERELWQTIDALHSLYEMRDLRYVVPKRS